MGFVDPLAICGLYIAQSQVREPLNTVINIFKSKIYMRQGQARGSCL